MFKKLKMLAVMLVIAVLSVSLVACGSNGSQQQSSSKEPALMVTDMNGDDVIEAGTAKNILTVNSVATQMVLLCGGEDAAATLGQGFQYGDDSLNKKMFPNLGGLKTFTRDDCTVENVAAVDPSVVLIDVPDTVAALRDADIHAAYLSVVSPETIIQALELIGDCLGDNAAVKSSDYANYYNGVLATMSAKSKDVSEADKPHVLYLRSETRTIGANSMPDSWITTLGGINCGSELGAKGGAGEELNIEALIGSDPDIIICERPELVQTILSNAQYADTKAVKNGAVYAAPLGTAVWSMGTAEAPLMLYWASQYINPDLYQDVDVNKETKKFFKDFYGYDLTDADLDTIFHK